MTTDNFHGYNATMWTEGHNSETVTAIAALIMRQRSLMDALFMVEKTKA